MTSRSPARPMATAFTGLVMTRHSRASRVAGNRIPDLHRAVIGAGDDDVPVPSPPDGHRVHPAVMAGHGAPAGSPVTASQTSTVPLSKPETMTSLSPARPTATAFTGPSS